MEPVVSDGLWYVDSLDQFSRTIAVADGRPGGKLTRGSGRAKKTSVLLTTQKRRAAGPRRTTAAPAAPSSEVVYQLRIMLREVTPLVWRRILVTGDTTVAQLHAVLQTVMGWEDLHLHQFRIHGKAYGVTRAGGIWFDDNPHQVRLCALKRIFAPFCRRGLHSETSFHAWCSTAVGLRSAFFAVRYCTGEQKWAAALH